MIRTITAFLLFRLPQTREYYVTLDIGCALVFIAVHMEEGMGLVIAGLSPDVLGDNCDYSPRGRGVPNPRSRRPNLKEKRQA